MARPRRRDRHGKRELRPRRQLHRHGGTPSVAAALAGPSLPLTVLTGTPADKSRVAAKCRRSWSRTVSSLTRLRSRMKSFVTSFGAHGRRPSASGENRYADAPSLASHQPPEPHTAPGAS